MTAQGQWPRDGGDRTASGSGAAATAWAAPDQGATVSGPSAASPTSPAPPISGAPPAAANPFAAPGGYAGPYAAPPAAATPYAAPVASGWGSFRRVRGLGTATIWLAVSWAGVKVLSALAAAAAVGEAGPGPATALYGLLALLHLAVAVASWVVGAQWATGVMANGRLLAPGAPHRSEAWGWLGWVVPVVHLWIPYQVVSQAGTLTVSAVRDRVGRMPRFSAWWSAWLIMNLLGTITNQTDPFEEGVSTAHAWMAILTAVATVVAAGLWIDVVRTVTLAQDRLLERGPTPYAPYSPQQAVPQQAVPQQRSYAPGPRPW